LIVDTPAQLPDAQRNHALDGLRGVAALSVALGHCVLDGAGLGLWNTSLRDFPSLPWVSIGLRILSTFLPSDAAVMVFFALSGLVLWQSFRRKNSRLIADLPDYVSARLFRLLPLTIVTCLPLAFLLDTSARELAMNMLLLTNKLNGVTWSLQVEMVASLGLFVLWGLTSGTVWKTVAALLLVLAAIPFCRGNPYVVFLPAFILGALITSIPKRLFEYRNSLPVAIAVLMFTNLIFGHGGLTRCFEIVGATIVVGAVSIGRLPILNSRVCQFLGAVSYPFYLVHPIVMAAIFPLIPASVRDNGFATLAILAITTVPIAIPIAWLLHAAVEMPVLRGRPRIAPLWRAHQITPSAGSGGGVRSIASLTRSN
jgi:peptidoglycan/LPS O-acetylase OafA/YrhL